MVRRSIAVVADPYTAQLFRLLGVRVFEASSSEEAINALKNIESDTGIGVLLVAADIYDEIADHLERLRRVRSDLVVSKLPTLRSPGKPMDVQRELLRALGMG